MKKFYLVIWTIVCFFGCASTVTPAEESDVVFVIVDSPSTSDSAHPTSDASEASADASDAVIDDANDATSDVTPPTVSAISPTTATAGVSEFFSATYSDSGSGVTQCQLSEGGSILWTGGTFAPTADGTATIGETLLAGTYHLQMQCRDAAGNWGYGPVTTITVDAVITVSLSPATPPGRIIPRNSDGVPMVRFDFVLPSSDDAVSGLRLHHVGVGSSEDIQNVYLYDADTGERLTSGRSVNRVTGEVAFNSLDDGTSYARRSFLVVCDFAAPSAGGQHAFEITDVTSVNMRVPSGRITGSFPARGNGFTVSAVLAARLDVRKGSQPANPVHGTDAEISNVTLTANGGNVATHRLALLQAGSISNADLTDLRLFQGSTMIASAAALERGYIVLRFTAPLLVMEGFPVSLSLRAHVGGPAGRTIRTYMEYSVDAATIDPAYGSPAAVCNSSRTLGGCTATGQGFFDGTLPEYIEVTTL